MNVIKVTYNDVEYSVSCEQDLLDIIHKLADRARFWEEVAEEREFETMRMFNEVLKYRRICGRESPRNDCQEALCIALKKK